MFVFSPSNPGIGQAVTFDGTASFDPDGTITNFAWTFGDGTTGSGSVTTHAYASFGSFNITLVVTDNVGLSGVAGATITVLPPPGAHASFFQWSVRAQFKKFSITNQGPTEPIEAFAVNDGNVSVWAYTRFIVTGDSGVNQVLYTQIVQLNVGQQINGNADPRFSASFTPVVPGAYLLSATVYYSVSSSAPPIGDPSFFPNPSQATASFTVRP